jgi:hypothetical protein
VRTGEKLALFDGKGIIELHLSTKKSWRRPEGEARCARPHPAAALWLPFVHVDVPLRDHRNDIVTIVDTVYTQITVPTVRGPTVQQSSPVDSLSVSATSATQTHMLGHG